MNQPPMSLDIEASAARIAARQDFELSARTDHVFIWLMILQWVGMILIAAIVSPRAWAGAEFSVHIHLWAAATLGATICLFPICMAKCFAGTKLSRYTIAVGQGLASALIIHLTGGRIESHFHIFGSLAFVAFYRDWKAIAITSAVVAVDHILRGAFLPQSIYGVMSASNWRSVEHIAWVVFEDIFLIAACRQARVEMKQRAEREALLETTNDIVEAEVVSRTADLVEANENLTTEIRERRAAEEERDRMGRQLQQHQKLEAIGQLSAGVAHEINTPTQFIGDNMRFLRDAFQDLMPLVRVGGGLPEDKSSSGEAKKDQTAVDASEIEFLSEEVPRAIEQSLEGIQRVSRIVQSMKEFSHPGAADMTPVDINQAVDSTIIVSSNEWKYCATMERDFDEDLPLVNCLPGEINQVILNLIVNAAHAITDAKTSSSDERGRILVRTRHIDDNVEIQVSDTGAGISAENGDKVFDPFFTTKEVGRGSGQGLSIARNIIVHRHEGSLEFESEPGKGTTFTILLPLNPSPDPDSQLAVNR